MKEKQIKVLLTLSNLGILNRKQIQALCNTKGVRNTNYLLNSLSPYIEWLEHQNGRIYKLSRKGINLLGEGRYLEWGNVDHRLLRNDVYIKYRPSQWFPEREIKVGNIRVQPDCYFISGITHKFLEVDRTQRWVKNTQKVKTYVKLKQTKAFQQEYGHFPTLVWVVEVDSRKDKLNKLCHEHKLHCEVYTKGEIQC